MLTKSISMQKNPKILLVDDNKDLLQVVQIILKGQGFDTVLAESVEEAERKIKFYHPALVLMDVFIGDEDGRLLCSQLKNDKGTNDISVILMSGQESTELNENDIMDLADDFLPKPLQYNDLVGTVRQHYHQSIRA